MMDEILSETIQSAVNERAEILEIMRRCAVTMPADGASHFGAAGRMLRQAMDEGEDFSERLDAAQMAYDAYRSARTELLAGAR